MTRRGMIMQERTEEVLVEAMCSEFVRMPHATWVTAEQLASASPELQQCGGDRYEVVSLGSTVSLDEVRMAALAARNLAAREGLFVDSSSERGFAVYNRSA